MDLTKDFQRKTLFCRVEQQATQGFVERRDLPLQERLHRMLKIGGLLLAAACAAVFIPILHFVLVPVLLICALIFGIVSWLDKAEILRGEFPLPTMSETKHSPPRQRKLSPHHPLPTLLLHP